MKHMDKFIKLDDFDILAELNGVLSRNLAILEKQFAVSITLRSDGLVVAGANELTIEGACGVLQRLINLRASGNTITTQLVTYLSGKAAQGDLTAVSNFSPDGVCVTAKGKVVACKTAGQSRYIEAIKKNEVVFAIGPAGTGKTFLAVAMAVNSFRERSVDRIILTRPAVEAGEKLGFLPGDLQMKVDPYMRPLYDALHDLMGADQYLKNQERGVIEVSPLAYMRGRTLDNAFIILDEAQNTTPEQMKMFLTRIGFNSKVIVTGDITQIDLPAGKTSGLCDARRVLKNIDGIKFIELTCDDVVRNGIVQSIILAYDKADKHRAKHGGVSSARQSKTVRSPQNRLRLRLK